MRHPPMPLVRSTGPFDHPDWLFELKYDGFRALAYVEGHLCRLVSRRGHEFTKFTLLAEEIAHTVRLKRAVLDGEIVCLGPRSCYAVDRERNERTVVHRVSFREPFPIRSS